MCLFLTHPHFCTHIRFVNLTLLEHHLQTQTLCEPEPLAWMPEAGSETNLESSLEAELRLRRVFKTLSSQEFKILN